MQNQQTKFADIVSCKLLVVRFFKVLNDRFIINSSFNALKTEIYNVWDIYYNWVEMKQIIVCLMLALTSVNALICSYKTKQSDQIAENSEFYKPEYCSRTNVD